MYLLLYGRLMAGVEAKMTFSEVTSDVVLKVGDGRGICMPQHVSGGQDSVQESVPYLVGLKQVLSSCVSCCTVYPRRAGLRASSLFSFFM